MRRKRLKNRLEKRLPLFADVLFEQELETRPDHFAGERITPTKGSDQ